MSSRSSPLNAASRGKAFNNDIEQGLAAAEGISLSSAYRGDSTLSPSVYEENAESSKSSSIYSDDSSSFDGDDLDGDGGDDDQLDQNAVPLGEGTVKTDMANIMGLPPDHFEKKTYQDVLDMIPKDEDGELTSVGSVLHETGSCMPCLFLMKTICRKKFHCRYCHIPPSNVKSKRKSSKDSEPRNGSSRVLASEVIQSRRDQITGCSTRNVDKSVQSKLVTRYSL
eukprot:TRINITY_DN5548_c0_g3_i1.p1 TRINITY_DN5548_c0_g3~~TRINITY_DN5548_c0_g3_i1.p1  ORF type:complete len:225 (-),score=25.87 TRINITY_DN5548_c0_g3_i1:767-1441(-)